MTSTAATNKPSAGRRGRPRAGERAERRRAVLEAAFAELAEHGYEKVTMLGVAKRAGASKETLYSWFGNREGLFAALITENADASAERVRAALAGDGEPRQTLTGYAIGLLTLLTDDRSIALNRGAMTSPELAEILLAQGRHRVGPVVEAYLARLAADGFLAIDDPADAFTLLYGLVVRDTQIRVLLGERPPSKRQIAARAELAVDRFLLLTS